MKEGELSCGQQPPRKVSQLIPTNNSELNELDRWLIFWNQLVEESKRWSVAVFSLTLPPAPASPLLLLLLLLHLFFFFFLSFIDHKTSIPLRWYFSAPFRLCGLRCPPPPPASAPPTAPAPPLCRFFQVGRTTSTANESTSIRQSIPPVFHHADHHRPSSSTNTVVSELRGADEVGRNADHTTDRPQPQLGEIGWSAADACGLVRIARHGDTTHPIRQVPVLMNAQISSRHWTDSIRNEPISSIFLLFSDYPFLFPKTKPDLSSHRCFRSSW